MKLKLIFDSKEWSLVIDINWKTNILCWNEFDEYNNAFDICVSHKYVVSPKDQIEKHILDLIENLNWICFLKKCQFYK
jgi:hypothetical protein